MPRSTKKGSSRKRSAGPRARDYQVVVRWSDEDQCFIARVPALDGCITHGDTETEALAEGYRAAQLWLDSAFQHRHPVPKPPGQYSGKMTIRLPASLHQRIAEEAEREGVSINQWVLTRLAG